MCKSNITMYWTLGSAAPHFLARTFLRVKGNEFCFKTEHLTGPRLQFMNTLPFHIHHLVLYFNCALLNRKLQFYLPVLIECQPFKNLEFYEISMSNTVTVSQFSVHYFPVFSEYISANIHLKKTYPWSIECGSCTVIPLPPWKVSF